MIKVVQQRDPLHQENKFPDDWRYSSYNEDPCKAPCFRAMEYVRLKRPSKDTVQAVPAAAVEVAHAGKKRFSSSVTGAQEQGEGLKKHTVYIVKVVDKDRGEQWEVRRRYRQFTRLCRALEEKSGSKTLPVELPPKEWVGGRHGDVVRKRLVALNDFVAALAAGVTSVPFEGGNGTPATPAMMEIAAFLELIPSRRGTCSFARLYGPESILMRGSLRMKDWKGPHKLLLNSLDLSLGWFDTYCIVSEGPVLHALEDPEADPTRPLRRLPKGKGSLLDIAQQPLTAVRAGLHRNNNKNDTTESCSGNSGTATGGGSGGQSDKFYFFVMWEGKKKAVLCEVDTEEALMDWFAVIDPLASPLQVEVSPGRQNRQKYIASIELKAREACRTREEDLWGGL